ncbi:MAG: UDP-glucose 4-epimerase [Variovorax sp.]|nr:UDP-glucose 4-epimerase [Variovorax sp.]
MTRTVLVTGGAGFIGSHACVALAAAGYEPLILDNFCNSDVRVIERLSEIIGKAPAFVEGDVRDKVLLHKVFREHEIDAVIHFAGLKAVGDSVAHPLHYYDTNVSGTVVLAAEMQRAGVKTLVFSSSATVYGEPECSPIPEGADCRPESPYGRSKHMVEQMLTDLHRSQPDWNVIVLRYFNPVGAHESGLIGEQPRGKPNNLMPYLCQVATGERQSLQVHGSDYATPDGTGVRDYVHVMDLAEGHVAAVKHAGGRPGLLTLNLGTGQGYSVMDVINEFERATGQPIARQLGPRRPGDVAAYWGDPARAHKLLGWKARRGLAEMCADSWRWQRRNPAGYASRLGVEVAHSGIELAQEL